MCTCSSPSSSSCAGAGARRTTAPARARRLHACAGLPSRPTTSRRLGCRLGEPPCKVGRCAAIAADRTPLVRAGVATMPRAPSRCRSTEPRASQRRARAPPRGPSAVPLFSSARARVQPTPPPLRPASRRRHRPPPRLLLCLPAVRRRQSSPLPRPSSAEGHRRRGTCPDPLLPATAAGRPPPVLTMAASLCRRGRRQLEKNVDLIFAKC